MEVNMRMIKTNDQTATLKPFGGFVDELLNNTLGRFMDDDLVRADFPRVFPPVNIAEGKEAYFVDLAVPGLEKSDFKINLEGNNLFISAEKKEEKEEQKDKQIRKEYSFRSFKRSFTIDDSIDTGKIDARYENGILKVVLPKKEEKIQQNKEISIS